MIYSSAVGWIRVTVRLDMDTGVCLFRDRLELGRDLFRLVLLPQ
jgi:hypothetical protein